MKHPECRNDEVFLGNTNDEGFRHIGWKTKRMGMIAFGNDGEPLDEKWPDGKPVFVKKAEIAMTNGAILERIEKRNEACIYNPDISFEGGLRLL